MVSSPHEGHAKTVGSFFLTTLMTLLRRLPILSPLSYGRHINEALFQRCTCRHEQGSCCLHRDSVRWTALLSFLCFGQKVLSEYETVSLQGGAWRTTSTPSERTE